jgi:hypothetical protein
MKKQTKTKLFFILSTIFFVSIVFAACNSSESEKTETKDSATVAPIKTDTMPVIDTMRMDSGEVKPTPTPN